jgi:hypothetical protein
VPNVTLWGAGRGRTTIRYYDPNDAEHVVLEAAENTVIRSLALSLPGTHPNVTVLLRAKDVSCTVRWVDFDGRFNQNSTAMMVVGSRSSNSSAMFCKFMRLNDGVWAVGSGIKLFRNQFKQILGDAVFVGLPPGAKSGTPLSTPAMGTADDGSGAGFNEFREVDGYFVRSFNGAMTYAEYNDWGLYEADAIADKMSGLVSFDHFLGPLDEAYSLLVDLVDADTGAQIEEVANVSVTIDALGLSASKDRQSNIYSFQNLASGSYEVFVTAPGYLPEIRSV